MNHDHKRKIRSTGVRRLVTAALLLPAWGLLALLPSACQKKKDPPGTGAGDGSGPGGAVEDPARPFQIYEPFLLPTGHPPDRTIDWKPIEIDPSKLERDPSRHPGRQLAEIHCIRPDRGVNPAQLEDAEAASDPI